MRNEPIHSHRHRTQITAHHWTEDQKSQKHLQATDASKRSRPHADCQAAGSIWPGRNPPTDLRGRLARCPDVEVVADTINPPGESPLIHPAAPVMNFIARSSPRPLPHRVVLAKRMHILKVSRSRDYGPHQLSRSENLAGHSNWSCPPHGVTHHSIVAGWQHQVCARVVERNPFGTPVASPQPAS